ncbi:MAG: glycine cleavage system protein GcvH [Anaerolineae bacterium]|nr:glycine cleavage system protein GcvH [Anaerolineae bacterium]
MGKWKAPADLKYSKTDEWLRVEGDSGVIGVSDYAQDQLNDVVFLELPEVGAKFERDAVFGVVESVKAASDLHMPVAGTITEVNHSAEDDPETVNTDPYGVAWLVKVKLDNPPQVDDLMDVAAYEEYCEGR